MADAGADLPGAVLQRLLDAAARTFEGRREAADDRGRERHRGGEGEHRITQVTPDRDRRGSTGLIASSSASPHCATSRPRPPPSTHSTRLSVSSCRMTRIAAGAERAADRDLALARRAAREQQVGDVGARDQQHEADRAGQHEQRRPQIAGQLAVHRHEQRAPAGVELRKLLASARWRSCPSAPALRSARRPASGARSRSCSVRAAARCAAVKANGIHSSAGLPASDPALEEQPHVGAASRRSTVTLRPLS